MKSLEKKIFTVLARLCINDLWLTTNVLLFWPVLMNFISELHQF